MNIVMLGAPGAGKGTYASKITAKYGLVKISTGDLLRQEIDNKSDIGQQIRLFVDSGELVPDEITIQLLKKKLSKIIKGKGIIFDGFPRNVGQAKALDEILKERDEGVNYVFFINTPKELVIERISGRRVCKNCGAIYHIPNIPPKMPGVCDKCGKALYQRDDDKPEVVSARFDEYDIETKPLINLYRQRKILFEIDGTKDIKENMQAIAEILE
jgi:adenylate kinase